MFSIFFNYKICQTKLVKYFVKNHVNIVFHINSIINVVIVFTEEPDTPPVMRSRKLKYSKDEQVKINCTSSNAFPATNLTWFINDKKVRAK